MLEFQAQGNEAQTSNIVTHATKGSMKNAKRQTRRVNVPVTVGPISHDPNVRQDPKLSNEKPAVINKAKRRNLVNKDTPITIHADLNVTFNPQLWTNFQNREIDPRDQGQALIRKQKQQMGFQVAGLNKAHEENIKSTVCMDIGDNVTSKPTILLNDSTMEEGIQLSEDANLQEVVDGA